MSARADPPAELARWLAPQVWEKDADGPIVSLGEPGHAPAAAESTFVDLWIHGLDTAALKLDTQVELSDVFRVSGNQSFGTTCGGRSLPLPEIAKDQ
jgi:hypothetical protein